MLWHVSENYLITKQHGGKNSLRCTDNLAMIAFFCLHSTGAAISTEVIFFYTSCARKIWTLIVLKRQKLYKVV